MFSHREEQLNSDFRCTDCFYANTLKVEGVTLKTTQSTCLESQPRGRLTATDRIYFKMNWKAFSHEKVKALISGVCSDSQHIHSWSKTELSAEQGFWEAITFNLGRIPTARPVRWLSGITFFCFKMYNFKTRCLLFSYTLKVSNASIAFIFIW